MGEPAVGAVNQDDREGLSGERLEPIWSELDFIGNGVLKDIFTPSDIEVRKLDAGSVKVVEGGSLANGVVQERIGADFWTRREAKDSLDIQLKMDGLTEVKEEPVEILPNQAALVDGNKSFVVPPDPRGDGIGSVRVKEETIFEERRPESIIRGVSIVKQEKETSQEGLLEGTGRGVLRVKQEECTQHEESQVAEVTVPAEDTEMEEVQQPEDSTTAEVGNVDIARQRPEEGAIEAVRSSGSVPEMGILDSSSHGAEEPGAEDLLGSGPQEEECTEMIVQPPQYEVQHAELGGLLKDGVLSSTGLEKQGVILIDDSSSEEESESFEDEEDSESEEEEDSESDESSDNSSSEEEEMKTIKEKIRRSNDETKEDTEPPRTKNEVSVLPRVPKVEAVLEPHHTCVPMGLISSVVDLYIVVEGKKDSKVLADGSILWLTESRVPLGIVDEVFGPVKKPYYSLRFNEASDLHESAKVGADISYVAEFAEFVLKDNPNLYKKALDASGLDDEELSDAEIEFSDDEKEMAAKQRERGKRGHDSKENGTGQTWDSSESQPPEAKGRWQGRERARGRGQSRGGGPYMKEGLDYATKSVAGMDLRRSGFNAGNMNHRGRTRARPGAGRSNFQSSSRSSNSRGWDGPDLGATYSRLHDGLSRGDWVPSPTRHSPGAGPSPNGSHHQVPLLRRDERRDGPWYSEQVDLTDRQPHQAVPVQGHPSFGLAPVHRHSQGPGAELRQQVGSGFPAFGYTSVAGPQIATDGQGNFFHITGPVLPPDVSNVGRMGINSGPAVVSVLPPTSPNTFSLYNRPVQGTLNLRHGGYDSVYQADVNHRGQPGGYTGPSVNSNRMASPEFSFQSMPSNRPMLGPGDAGSPQGSGYARNSNRMAAPEFIFQGMPSSSPMLGPGDAVSPQASGYARDSNRMAAPDFRFQSMPSNSPILGPGDAGSPQASGYAHDSNRMAAPDFRFQSMPSNSPILGPGDAGGFLGSGYARGSPPQGHRQRYQGSRRR